MRVHGVMGNVMLCGCLLETERERGKEEKKGEEKRREKKREEKRRLLAF